MQSFCFGATQSAKPEGHFFEIDVALLLDMPWTLLLLLTSIYFAFDHDHTEGRIENTRVTSVPSIRLMDWRWSTCAEVLAHKGEIHLSKN